MILDRLQRFLTLSFLTTLLFSQALVFVAVRAANNSSLEAIFVEPVSDNLVIGDNVYFQAMLSNGDEKSFDFVAFNLKSFEYGIDDNYQASLQADGTWKAQSAWQTGLNYQPGTYYLSAVAHIYQNGQLENIYISDYKIINLDGKLQASAETVSGQYTSPTEGQAFNFSSTDGASSYFLDIKFNINRTLIGGRALSDYVQTINFNVSKYESGSDMALIDSYTATKIAETSSDVWSARVNLQDLKKFPAGNYQVAANIYLDSELTVSGDVQTIFNNMDYDVNFQIIRLSSVPVPTADYPTTITITSPSSTSPITGDTLVVMGELDRPLPASATSDRQVEMTLAYRGNTGPFTSSGPYVLSSLNDSAGVLYGTTIVLSGTNESSEGAAPIPQFPNGVYTMSFKLIGDNIEDVNLATGSFELARALISSEQIITLANPQPGQKITGNNLTLNFITSFPATDFYYRVISSSTPSIGVEGYIDAISGQTSWTKTISALQHSDLINGYYNVSAVAHNSSGQTINFGPRSIYWQIIEDNVQPLPSLTAYVPANSQLGPDASIWGSANVPNVIFKLKDTSNNIRTLTHTGVTCSSSSIGFLSGEVISGAEANGHQYCFYAVLGDGISLANGNYRFYLEYLSGSAVVNSSERTISYFNAANLENVSAPVFQFLGVSSSTINGLFNIFVASNLDQNNLAVQLKKIDTSSVLRTFNLPKGTWSSLSGFGINANSYPNLPFVYIQNNVNSTQWSNGIYSLSIVGHETSTINISVDNGRDATDTSGTSGTPIPNIPVTTSTSGITSTPSSTESIVRVNTTNANNIGISYDATCRDWSITDLAECQRFTAVKNSLDESCLRLGLFEPTACEEYIYRINIDSECQTNGIVGQEECRNYLLEKYGSRVDCRLSDINLCNDVLKNRYLGRLVLGQKLSDNINEVVDPLVGQNISVRELGDSLAARGISSLEVLPLLAADDSRVSIVRAQKETVLEEEDRLTILNQAVIILDSDGDGLSDDLEGYYGTDVNNPDTDGDGYSDGTEINNGYDPAGPGPLLKERTNFDRVVLSGQWNMEQPKTSSDKIDSNFSVSAVDRKDDANIMLTGTAEANTWVNLYLYSGLPLVMVTKTDASGNWSYDIKKSLTDGHHKVFVTVNDDTGKILKQSRPISFLIKEAQAVSVDDYFDESGANETVDNFFIYYILGGAFLVFLALGIVVFVHKGRNQNLEI